MVKKKEGEKKNTSRTLVHKHTEVPMGAVSVFLVKHWKMPAELLVLPQHLRMARTGTCSAGKATHTPQADTMGSGIWSDTTYNVHLTPAMAVYLLREHCIGTHTRQHTHAPK